MCIGSRAELSELTGEDQSKLDPHRPFVDRITFDCPECGKTATRVPSVIDVWFDSGSMPFAQWHYPFENRGGLRASLPGRLHQRRPSTRREAGSTPCSRSATMLEGPKLLSTTSSASVSSSTPRVARCRSPWATIIDPWAPIDEHGADAMRWLLLTGGSPWQARRIGVHMIQESLRKYLMTLWNTYSFWVTYATLEDFDPTGLDIDVGDRSEMDRWVLAELDDTVRTVTDGSRGVRRNPLGAADRALRRRPDQLVRAPKPPAVLEHEYR